MADSGRRTNASPLPTLRRVEPVSDPQAASRRCRTARPAGPRPDAAGPYASAIPTTRAWGRGWPKNRCATSISRRRRRGSRAGGQGHRRLPHRRGARDRSLGNTLASWRAEILAHHHSGASNGPTEGLNLLVKVKRCGHGFTNFENYRLRVLLHVGGVSWPTSPSHLGSEPALPTQTRRVSSRRPLRPHSGRGTRRLMAFADRERMSGSAAETSSCRWSASSASTR